jgi:glycosyltransferase involved in cell wall biosynthesis
MKILLVAFALNPFRGSEAATAWGWATSLAGVHEVTVVSREEERHDFESALAKYQGLDLRIEWVPSPRYVGPMAGQIKYLLWLRKAARVCKTLVEAEKYDLIHHVSYGSINVATQFWKLSPPFVLGPVGGGQSLNPEFQKILGPMPISERLRNLRVCLLPFRPAIRKMVKNSSLVLVTNHETEMVVRRMGALHVTLFSDTGVRKGFCIERPSSRSRDSGLRLLWVGRMLYRKGVAIALKALKKTGRTDISLDLVGTGPLRRDIVSLVDSLRLSGQVHFHGQVPFDKVTDFYDRADLFVFPSVNDAFGSQLLEASSRGLPSLVLNMQGAKALLPDAAAWKISTSSAEKVVDSMADALNTLAGNPEILADMSSAAIAFARSELWENRVDKISSLYMQIAK